MTSSLYGKPPGGGSRKAVIALGVAIVVLLGLVLFLLLRPTSSGTATAPSTTSGPGATTAVGSNPPVSGAGGSSGTAPPDKGSAPWTIPVAGDGGPSTKSAASVPRGYDASDSGATKAAVNAVVAGRWMKFRVDNPAQTLGELAIPDQGDDRDAVIQQLTPKQIAGGAGKEQSPAGGKVLGAELVSRDANTAVVKVLWEQFGTPLDGKVAVTLELIEVRLSWIKGDWLISSLVGGSLHPDEPWKNAAGVVGKVDEPVPVPGESWYW